VDCVELLILLGSVNFELDHKPDEVLSLVLDRSLACAIPHHITVELSYLSGLFTRYSRIPVSAIPSTPSAARWFRGDAGLTAFLHQPTRGFSIQNHSVVISEN
jgi:hypothetical protein